MQLPDNSINFVSQHDAVLSRLDYWQNKDGLNHYYSKEEFEPKLSTFDIPIIYAGSHPKTGLRGRNLEEVLKEVNGKVVGFNSNTLINNMGSPKLSSVFNITDSETDLKIKNGEVSQSLGFWYSAPDNGSLKNVSGDHVLLYDRSSGIKQGDVASLILNQDNQDFSNPDHSNNNTTETAYFGYLSGEIQLKNNQGAINLAEDKPIELNPYAELLKTNQAVIMENKDTVLKLNQEIEKEKETVLKLNQAIEEKDKLLSNQAEQLKILGDQIKGIVEEQLKANQEANWNTFLEGTRDHFKDRKGELGDLNTALKLNTDMKTFEDKLEKNPLKEAQGDKNLKTNQDEDERRPGVGKPTSYNPFTGKME